MAKQILERYHVRTSKTYIIRYRLPEGKFEPHFRDLNAESKGKLFHSYTLILNFSHVNFFFKLKTKGINAILWYCIQIITVLVGI